MEKFFDITVLVVLAAAVGYALYLRIRLDQATAKNMRWDATLRDMAEAAGRKFSTRATVDLALMEGLFPGFRMPHRAVQRMSDMQVADYSAKPGPHPATLTPARRAKL